MKASNLVAKANFLLNMYGLLVEIEYETSQPWVRESRPRKNEYEFTMPIGIRMTKMNLHEIDDGVIRA